MTTPSLSREEVKVKTTQLSSKRVREKLKTVFTVPPLPAEIIGVNRERESRLSQDDLKALMVYDPDTGLFKWVSGKYVGQVAGTKNKLGYCRIYIVGHFFRFLAHRLAWLYMTGEWPSKYIDHIDGNPENNKWNNLRQVSSSQNSLNSRVNTKNKSGIKGVSFMKQIKKWKAKVQINKVVFVLGYFDNLDDAAEAVRAGRERLHGEFAHHG